MTDADRFWDVKLHLREASRNISWAVENALQIDEDFPEVDEVLALGAVVDRLIERVIQRMESIEDE